MGFQALNVNTVDGNVAVGFQALRSNSTGTNNVATGFQSLFSNATGGANTAMGFQALNQNTSNGNTAVGFQAGFGSTSSTNGEGNTAIGFQALFSNAGGDNTAIGNSALFGSTAVNDNVALGAFAGGNVSTADNVICIGSDVGGENTSNRTYIGNIGTFTQNPSVDVNHIVTVNLATGRLGNFIPVSSRRYKEDIKPLDKTSEALFSLKPVSYRLKKEFDPTQPLAFGLIAEEVEKVNPDLVSRNNKGQVESVRYEMVNAMMLNEFLKEHRKNEEQEATIAQLKSGMEALTATVKEQASQIQKVSAQLEARKAAPQIVNNNQ
jgi:hypothetical protein